MPEDSSLPASPSSETQIGENLPSVRRRRRLTVSGTGREDPARIARVSLAAFVGMVLLGLYGVFTAGAPVAVHEGGMAVGFGLLLVCLPPRFKVSWIWWLAGVLVLAGAAMAFLPAAWFKIPEWRIGLEALGQPIGGMVTMQPRVTAEVLAKLTVSVVAVWFLLGHRVTDRAHQGLALLVALGVSAYGLVSMMAQEQELLWAWDPNGEFGLFPNRNHTATILVVGAVSAMGVLREAVRLKRGGLAGMATLAIVVCVWGVLGFNTSRAGVLLLLGAALLWLAGLGLSGTRYLSRTILLTIVGFALAGGSIFWWTDNSLRKRLEESWAKMEQSTGAGIQTAGGAIASAGGVEGRDAALVERTLELRWLIYQDTITMIAKEPPTGVGLGQFPAVFPNTGSTRQFWPNAGIPKAIG